MDVEMVESTGLKSLPSRNHNTEEGSNEKKQDNLPPSNGCLVNPHAWVQNIVPVAWIRGFALGRYSGYAGGNGRKSCLH